MLSGIEIFKKILNSNFVCILKEFPGFFQVIFIIFFFPGRKFFFSFSRLLHGAWEQLCPFFMSISYFRRCKKSSNNQKLPCNWPTQNRLTIKNFYVISQGSNFRILSQLKQPDFCQYGLFINNLV